jgi:hypothetical protein
LLAVIRLVLIAYDVPGNCSDCAGAWLQLSQMDDEADGEVLACLASSAPQIGSLLQRPGLIADLHAAEPYAVVSLVVSVLRAIYTLPGFHAGDDRLAQAYHHLQSAAGHCLE